MSTKKLLSEEIIIDLQEYAKNPQGFVILQGKNGRGKTHAALTIYQQNTPYVLPERDWDKAWFVNQSDLNMLFTEAHEIYGHVTNLLRQAYATRLLILDDLGTRTPSEAFKDFLYAIIDQRYKERESKGTIITTNLDSTRLRKDFSDAIFSRIACGRNYVVIGEDRRFTDLGF
jgi:DNA replication protein DnaC